MAISTEPLVPPDPLVRLVRPDEIDTLLPASVAMFTEEVGVSPVGPDGGAAYRARVAELIRAGRSYARIEHGQVIFKAEIGAVTPMAFQVQGVWVPPELRARGHAARGMAAGRRAAASYVRELLERPGAYRRLWEQHVVRARPGEITQLAVAEVLARYLWSYPRVPGDADVLPHQLKDTVSRALSGRLLSRSALSLFIEAFGLSGQEADRLWRLWEGSGTISVLSGTRAVTARTEQELHAAIGPRPHPPLSLHEHGYMGADALPGRAPTLPVLEAI